VGKACAIQTWVGKVGCEIRQAPEKRACLLLSSAPLCNSLIGENMPKKTSTAPAQPINLEEIKPHVLRNLVELMEETPPLGEKYEMGKRKLIEQAIKNVGGNSNPSNLGEMVEEVYQDTAGFGPIEKYLHDPVVSEIMVNGPEQIFVEKNGELLQTDNRYENETLLRLVVNNILNPIGRYVNYAHSMVDSHLPDGSRVNIVVPPVAQQGSCISIRKFMKDKLSIEDLIRLDSITAEIAEFIGVCVRGRLNVVVAGNTSSGKTTLLNILATFIPNHERIVTIEDSVELKLLQTHKVSLEAKPPDYKDMGEVAIRDLVKNSLRMRPDRIIVGEVRGGEALDMLQAMNTGHDGSMTTVHSNSPRDTLSRIETMTLMSGVEIPLSAIRRQIAAALDLIVYLTRFPDGTRKVTQITEVVGMEGDIITLTDIFLFHQTGLDEKGRPKGQFRSTGLRPMFSPKLEAVGYRLEQHLFKK
jgi:pilus assembly protein CpaF